PGFSGLRIADRSGAVVQSVPPMPTALSIAGRPYFIEAVKTGRATVSDIITTTAAHAPPIVVVMAPLRADDHTGSGAGFATLNLSNFEKFVETYHTVAGAGIVVIDRHYQVVYASADSGYAVRNDLSGDPMVQESGRADDGIYQYQADDKSGARRAAQLTAVA